MQTTLLCLHGWGGSKDSFQELRAALGTVSVLEVLTPDLPGFGEEPEPSEPWNVDDYADWVESYIASHHTSGKLLLLGHSHGGRIALKLAARGSVPIAHLYLCAAAGIRHPRHIKRLIGLTLAKGGKLLLSAPMLRMLEPTAKRLLYKLVRVHDYERASPIMQKTLQKVSREDLRSLLPRITQPTDIFWGEQDSMTPVTDGRLMARTIPDAHLHVFSGVRHRVHRDRAEAIASVIQSHLQASAQEPLHMRQ